MVWVSWFSNNCSVVSTYKYAPTNNLTNGYSAAADSCCLHLTYQTYYVMLPVCLVSTTYLAVFISHLRVYHGKWHKFSFDSISINPTVHIICLNSANKSFSSVTFLTFCRFQEMMYSYLLSFYYYIVLFLEDLHYLITSFVGGEWLINW